MSSLLSGAAIDYWWISTNVVFHDNINEIAFNGWFPGLPIQSLYTVCVKVSDGWCKLCKNCDTTKLANLCSWYFYLPCVTFFKEVTSLARIGTDRGWKISAYFSYLTMCFFSQGPSAATGSEIWFRCTALPFHPQNCINAALNHNLKSK